MSVRYVFIGAGAVGGAIGGLLAEQGTDVLLVARGAHADALIAGGVTVRCPDRSFTAAAPTVRTPDQARLTTGDVLVLCTKTHQAEAALDQWADTPVHGADGAVVGRAAEVLPVLIATNGVASEEIALRYFARVFAVCVWFPAVMIDPGEVIIRSAPPRGVFHVGRFGGADDPAADGALLEALEADWGATDLTVARPDDVMGWKYRKLLSNLANVLQALVGDLSGAGDIADAAQAEARELLTAAAIAYPGDEEAGPWNGVVTLPVPGEPDQLGGSTWQSLKRGTGTIETDYLNGEITLLARRLGRAAPINTRLNALARRAARGGTPPGSLTAQALRAELRIAP